MRPPPPFPLAADAGDRPAASRTGLLALVAAVLVAGATLLLAG